MTTAESPANTSISARQYDGTATLGHHGDWLFPTGPSDAPETPGEDAANIAHQARQGTTAVNRQSSLEDLTTASKAGEEDQIKPCSPTPDSKTHLNRPNDGSSINCVTRLDNGPDKRKIDKITRYFKRLFGQRDTTVIATEVDDRKRFMLKRFLKG